MKRYPEYQLFEGNWLSSIPATWKQFRGKILFHDIDKRSETGEEELLTVSHITGVTPRKEKNVTMFKAESLEGYKLCEEGDFASNTMWMWMGAIGVSKYSGLVSPSYNVYRQKNFDYIPEYLEYLLREPNLVAEYRRHSTGVRPSRLRLYPDKFLNIVFPLPSLGEQKAIADFLDKKTEQIDRFISLQKEAISLLKELRQAEITKAVTKGLDENAEMKDSGVVWIGAIPSKWVCLNTLHVLSQPITDGPHTTPELYSEGIPFISAEAVSCGNGGIDFSHMRGYISYEFYMECCKKYVPQIDDIYMIKSGATTGKVSIVDTEELFTIWSPLAVFRSDKQKIIPKYLYYSLLSTPFQKQVQDGWTYGTQQNIGMRTLEHLKICVPQLSEQDKIISYLDKKCAEIDSAIQNKEALIEKVMEYKTRLISDAVTGNIDVRGEAI